MKTINIKHIENLHNDTLRGLDFYQEETKILQERLEEILADNTNEEVSKQVEHFQNQLIIHKSTLDDLRQEIHDNLELIKEGVDEEKGLVRKSTLDENTKLFQQYLTEEKLFNELRHEFYRFASKWM